MRKADVTEYLAHLAFLERRARSGLERFQSHGLPADDASIQRHRGYLQAIDDVRIAFERLRSARLRVNSHSDPGA